MKKDIKNLKEHIFDLAIVGAGVHGAILALEAVRAGYTVALLEKGDFCNSTSANSLKIIHGGIRYLQHGDVKRMRESIISRRSMMNFAPHLVRPLACMMPTYGHGIKGREMMRLAFGLYDLVAFDRNKGLKKENHLPCGKSISRDEVKRVVPGLNDKGLTGGAVWYDAVADNTERLVLEYIKEAANYGAVIANYSEVLEVLSEEKKVTAVVARDLQSGERLQVNCRAVVNATGPCLQKLFSGRSKLSGQLWAKAVNIVVRKKMFKDYAVGLEGYADYTDKDAIIKRGKRLFFFVPWLDRYTMIGTTYSPYHGSLDDFSLDREDIERVLDDVNKIYSPAKLCFEDVSFFHGGLLPMNEAEEKVIDSVQLDKSSSIIDHGQEEDLHGLITIKGVKYTTAPDIAKKVVMLLQDDAYLGRKEPGYLVTSSPQTGLGLAIRQLGKQYEIIRTHLENRYTTHWSDVFGYLQGQNGKLGKNGILWLSKDPPLMVCELLYFIHQEMAYTLSDVVMRRSNIGSAECPAMDTLCLIAEIMGRELGWDDEEQQGQINKVLEVYAPISKFRPQP